jgi:hypothetical protein
MDPRSLSIERIASFVAASTAFAFALSGSYNYGYLAEIDVTLIGLLTVNDYINWAASWLWYGGILTALFALVAFVWVSIINSRLGNDWFGNWLRSPHVFFWIVIVGLGFGLLYASLLAVDGVWRDSFVHRYVITMFWPTIAVVLSLMLVSAYALSLGISSQRITLLATAILTPVTIVYFLGQSAGNDVLNQKSRTVITTLKSKVDGFPIAFLDRGVVLISSDGHGWRLIQWSDIRYMEHAKNDLRMR